MPSKEKVSLAQMKVGILALVALACIIVIVFLLTGNASWFKTQVPLKMYTSDAAGLNPGSPVRINGIQAGSVKKVELSGEINPRHCYSIEIAASYKTFDCTISHSDLPRAARLRLVVITISD